MNTVNTSELSNYYHLYNTNHNEEGLLGLDYETTVYGEVDFLPMLAAYGYFLEDIQSCIMYLYGKTISHHEKYDIYSLDTNEFLYTASPVFKESYLTYPIDLYEIYKRTGNVRFKIVVDRNFGSEGFFLAKTDLNIS